MKSTFISFFNLAFLARKQNGKTDQKFDTKQKLQASFGNNCQEARHHLFLFHYLQKVYSYSRQIPFIASAGTLQNLAQIVD